MPCAYSYRDANRRFFNYLLFNVTTIVNIIIYYLLLFFTVILFYTYFLLHSCRNLSFPQEDTAEAALPEAPEDLRYGKQSLQSYYSVCAKHWVYGYVGCKCYYYVGCYGL